MLGYFRGWKRKVGLVTSVTACALTVAWLRSYSYFDYLQISLEKPFHVLASDYGKVVWIRNYEPLDGVIRDSSFFFRHSIEQKNRHLSELNAILFARVEPRWNWEFRKFSFTFVNGSGRGFQGSVRSAPYWSIVVPLTAFSAWLLLSKRRQPTKLEPSQELAV